MKVVFLSFFAGSAASIVVAAAALVGGCGSDGITPVCPPDTSSCITLPGDAGPPRPDSEAK
jgi:hypothetical protein